MSEKPCIDQAQNQTMNLNIREFEKPYSLLNKIPKKAQHGLLKSIDLVLTCIDATEDHVVLGSNVGVAFLFCRNTQNVERLRTKVCLYIL